MTTTGEMLGRETKLNKMQTEHQVKTNPLYTLMNDVVNSEGKSGYNLAIVELLSELTVEVVRLQHEVAQLKGD